MELQFSKVRKAIYIDANCKVHQNFDIAMLLAMQNIFRVLDRELELIRLSANRFRHELSPILDVPLNPRSKI